MNCHRRLVALKRGYVFTREEEIRGPLYYNLRCAGLDAHLEVVVPSIVHRSGMMRVDIGVIHNHELVVAIECKRPGKALPLPGSRQDSAYQCLHESGVKVHYINNADQIRALVKEVSDVVSGLERAG